MRNLAVLLGLGTLFVGGCAVTRLDLATDPARMTIIQRQQVSLPGSHDTLCVHIEDITGGQVLLSVRASTGRPVVDTMSVEQGDIVPFPVGAREYYLRVIELRNLPIGDDFGVFEVSASRVAKTQ